MKIGKEIILTLTFGIVMVVNNQLKAQNNMVLNQRQQYLVSIAACEAKGDQLHLTEIINKAFNDGLTVSEVKEALSHLYAYTGFPRSLNALSTLQKVLTNRENAHLSTNPGKEADAYPSDYDALRQGTEIQTKLCGGKPFNYSFSPATDYYLKAHLFGDIFARNNLSFTDRELVTVGALSSIDGLDSQLKSHIAGARNMGLHENEIRSIPLVLAQNVGEVEAYRARKAISETFGDTFVEGEPVDFNVWPKGVLNTNYSKYFIGDSYLASLTSADAKLPVTNVTFEPRCRNNWHVHHKTGQLLICVSGRGWYQEWGKPARELRTGDVVDIPAEVKHWHGAAKDSWFQHLALHLPTEGATNEWLEPVSDEEYNKLK